MAVALRLEPATEHNNEEGSMAKKHPDSIMSISNEVELWVYTGASRYAGRPHVVIVEGRHKVTVLLDEIPTLVEKLILARAKFAVSQ